MEDRIMSDKKVSAIMTKVEEEGLDLIEELLKAQDKLSFKAGYDKRDSERVEGSNEMIKLVLTDEELEDLKADYEKILKRKWHPTVFYLMDAVVGKCEKKANKQHLEQMIEWIEENIVAADYHSPEAGRGKVFSIHMEELQSLRTELEELK